jgi:nucleotide-binding universal stress UspA family protein
VAVANLFSKQIATKYGVAFTIGLFILFTLSERANLRRKHAERKGLEQFNLDPQAQIEAKSLHTRAGCVLVAVRDYERMEHLKITLKKTNLRRHDIVVMTVRQILTGAGEYGLEEEQIFSDYEKELFSHVVEIAEKEGKPVGLLVVPAVDPFDAMAQAANQLQASKLVTGVSARMESDELPHRASLAAAA